MNAEHAICQRASFEQHKAEQDRVPDAPPYRADGIVAHGDALNEHRVDCHTDEDQQTLKANGEQGFEIVLAHTSDFPVCQRGKRNGR